MNQNKKYIKVKGLLMAVTLFITAVVPLFSIIDVVHQKLDTDGQAMGVAVQGHYCYVADGTGGLKIINMSNPHGFVNYGRVRIPGGKIEQAAVSGSLVIMTDTTTSATDPFGKVHFVDVQDKMRPRLIGSLPLRGNKSRTVTSYGRTAFVVEYGDDPSEFSGIEVFTCGGTSLRSTQLTAIPNIRAVTISSKHIFAVTSGSVIAYGKSLSGFSTTEADRLAFPAGANINSAVLYGTYMFAFGDQLYVVGPILPELSIVFRWVPFPFPGGMFSEVIAAAPLELSIINRADIPGDRVNRRVDVAIPSLGGGTTTAPFVYILMTTRHCYGMYTFNYDTRDMEPFPILYRDSTAPAILFDIHAATDGKITIFDAVFPQYFNPGFFEGGVMGLGAIGSYGLGYVYLD